MGFYKIPSSEKNNFYKLKNTKDNNIEIIKTYIMLYPYWKDIYLKNKDLKEQSLQLLNLIFVENFFKDKSHTDIIVNCLMLKNNKGLEYIAYSMYYSESGLRNKINIILRDINLKIQKLTFLKFHDD